MHLDKLQVGDTQLSSSSARISSLDQELNLIFSVDTALPRKYKAHSELSQLLAERSRLRIRGFQQAANDRIEGKKNKNLWQTLLMVG